ncbi:acetyltransferase, GNAT family [Gottschalkia purinilytica]|uniref:Acetyltransferase, GNAT family n=1 Tax=Gottschalkia purinilytica TaxID=1503 RepID=A0A0L0WC58_GOTPU|nr:N-acetyltransferase [Gottschalkia purinilytica]KNF09051.1 acetyltransferase, GNAT family [Gottschalkia purinilytica]
MNIKIRKETEKDYSITEDVIEKAFREMEFTDHMEQYLVARLRKTENFIPELSLIAEVEGKVVGHILLSRITINNGEKAFESLALAPVSVLPEYQNKGIGSALISESIKIAKKMKFKSIIVLGHEKYYPKFGFRPASYWNITSPFEVPEKSFMALELEDGGLDGVSGEVTYPKAFFE